MRERGFREVFENRPDIGGRYSALSYFGLYQDYQYPQGGTGALPLAMAFAIASGVTPQAGVYTAIVAGFLLLAVTFAAFPAESTQDAEPYKPEEFPSWARSLRRGEIIAFGLLPFAFLFTSLTRHEPQLQFSQLRLSRQARSCRSYDFDCSYDYSTWFDILNTGDSCDELRL